VTGSQEQGERFRLGFRCGRLWCKVRGLGAGKVFLLVVSSEVVLFGLLLVLCSSFLLLLMGFC